MFNIYLQNRTYYRQNYLPRNKKFLAYKETFASRRTLTPRIKTIPQDTAWGGFQGPSKNTSMFIIWIRRNFLFSAQINRYYYNALTSNLNMWWLVIYFLTLYVKNITFYRVFLVRIISTYQNALNFATSRVITSVNC